jgi:hypothetical protein
VIDPGRAVGADLPEVCQTTPRDTGCSTTSPWVAKAVELRPCGATRGRLRGRVGPALPSHGRSHRFDPCHAHPSSSQVIPLEFTPRCRWETRRGSAGPHWGRSFLAGTAAGAQLPPCAATLRTAPSGTTTPPPSSGCRCDSQWIHCTRWVGSLLSRVMGAAATTMAFLPRGLRPPRPS